MDKRISQIISGFFTAIVLSFCLCGIVSAQEITGTLVGSVRDSAGGAVTGATVTIRDASKDRVIVRNLTTNESGEFTAPNLNISIFEITVEAPNFKKSVQTDIKLDVGQRRTVEIVLEAGAISETVTVEADPVAVDLQSATSGTLISGDQVRELSINNRNFTQLVALAPGVSSDLSDQVYVGTTNPEGQANTVQISVNGARSSQNTFTVDGADVTDRGSNLTIQAYPSVDSIGEFRVLRSLYPAESGRSGGGQVNVVTRSGTNNFRGNVFGFYRDEKLNANNFLANSQTNPQFGRNEEGKANRAPFSYKNYGWTLGGPVYFFNFGENDGGAFRRYEKTFFFFSQELRDDNRFAAPNLVTVPDANLKIGRFPIDVCINRNNNPLETCAVGSPFRLAANTPINPALINPVAAAYLRDIYSNIPNPNQATAANPYAASFSLENQFKFRQEIVKIDHTFSDKWSTYYRFQNDSIPSEEGNALFSSGSGLPGVSNTTTNSPGRTHTFQNTYAISPKAIIEARYNYSYGAILSQNVGLLSLNNSNIPITLPYQNTRDRNPSLTGNGFTGLTGFGPYDNFSNKNNYTGSFTYIFGNHTTKYGAVYSLYRKNENALAGNNEGSISAFPIVLPAGQTLPANISTAVAQNLQRWANFLVGNVQTFTQARFDYTADLRQKAFEAYAQDEWRVRRNLTLYYGVRYSFFGSPWDKNGRLTNFAPELFNPAAAPSVTGAGVRIAGSGNNCNGLIANAQNFTTGPAAFGCNPTPSPFGKFVIDAQKTDFAPRFGLAWDPFGKGRTSIRTGYGIYHEQVLNGTSLQSIGLNPPYQETITANNTRLDSPSGNLSVTTVPQGLRAIQTDFHTPYMQHWSLDWQQLLTNKTKFSIGYYGSKGTNLIGLTELNSLRQGQALNALCAPGNNYFGQAAAFTPVRCQTPGYAFRAVTNAVGNPNVVGTTNFQDNLILDQLRPYRGYRSIAIVQPRYNSNYHSLQISAEHRFKGASQVTVNYTYSKNLTDSQNDRTASPQDTYDTRSEYALAPLDRRHILTINYVYELPFFDKQEGFIGKVLGGWQASGIIVYNTGLPFTAVTSTLDYAGLGIINANPTARPNVLCNPNVNAPNTPQQWFNTACFERNPLSTAVGLQNTPGTSPRGNIFGPPTTRVDFTMMKNIQFRENLRLQLRAEVFNIFNTTNFRGFASLNVTSNLFGQIGSVRDPRNLQLAAKFYF